MSTGLIALLDDVAALAKLAAASLDDTAALAAKAGTKATGIVIDDAAVTPRYVVGFAARRELPIVGKIALGSLKNKLLILTPAALALSEWAHRAITPMLMAGGAYLCLEGFHKVVELARPGAHRADAAERQAAEELSEEVERARVSSAVRTDLILSAEILAITLADVVDEPIARQATVLVVVGVAMTALVYGGVALIVKADDFGVYLSRSGRAPLRAFGALVVRAMPKVLAGLTLLGMAAMLWVGGGIVAHGLHTLGVHLPEDVIRGAGRLVGGSLPVARGAAQWVVSAAFSAVFGVFLGAVVDGVVAGARWVRRRGRPVGAAKP